MADYDLLATTEEDHEAEKCPLVFTQSSPSVSSDESREEDPPSRQLIKEQAYEVDKDNFTEFSKLKAAEIKKKKRAKWVLYCLKSYMAVFIIFVVIMGVWMYSGALGPEEVAERREKSHLQEGYKTLRLGDRRIYYRLMEPEGMATHSILLVHGNGGGSEVFSKLGTLDFLREHGARVVAVDTIGMGKSDPPIHLLDSYEDFFAEVVSLFELEYNLVVVCLEEGCDRVLPYYLSHGVYQKENAFIEGAVLVAPRGDNLAKYIDPAKINVQTSTRTFIVVGMKDYVINVLPLEGLALIPRNEIHQLPNEKNTFYKAHKTYFHAAIQALTEGLEYSYDRDLQNIIKNSTDQQQQFPQLQQNFNQPLAYNANNQNYGQPIAANQYNPPGYNRAGLQQGRPYNPQQQGYNPQQQGYNPQQQQQPAGRTLFDKFKKTSNNNDMVYDPAHRFGNING